MTKAVIIAAGRGNRLRRHDGECPKPLYPVAGLPVIERVILSAKKAGIEDFVVVIGYQSEKVKRHLLSREKKMGVRIEFVENQDWEKANGFSVCKAREVVSDDFVLLMSDHIFDWTILHDLLKRPPSPGEVCLAVDQRLDEIFDLTDATKVQIQEGLSPIMGRIEAIGKEIGPYHAIDTGLFYCSLALFEALEIVCRDGNGSLSEAIGWLARHRCARTFDIGNRFWQDIDTPEALREAERILFESTRKPLTDGIISRHLNRKVSGWISKRLVRLPITPNQITFSALILGILSAYFVARAEPWAVAVGGLLFQFASIYDGCDGEVAKLKMCSSKVGEWLDTICDNVTYIAFITGVMIGAVRQGVPSAPVLGIFSLAGFLISFAVMSSYILRFTDSGSLVSFQRDLVKDLENSGFWSKFVSRMKYLVKRDFFAFVFMFLCLFNRLDWILILLAVGGNVTWLLLLFLKREFSRPVLSVRE